MYSLEQKLPRKNLKRGGGSGVRKNNFSVGYFIIIIAFIIFLIRSVNIINNYRERGGFAYVQMLNFSVPLVETQIYDEAQYADNHLSLKNVVLEAIGVKGLNGYSIVTNEISFFSSILGTDSLRTPISKLTPFSLNNNSIAKMTPEEIAELNKVSAAYDPSLKKTLDNTKPEVLILHTHTTENYIESEKDTTDSNFNVVGVGDVVSKELEEGYGISVMHDKTNHSVAYNDAYKRSNETLRKYIDEYGDFKVIIDLHRDGVDTSKSEQLKNVYTVNMNEQNLAKMMFVTAPNSSRYAENEKFVNNLYNIGVKLFPDLVRPVYVIDPAATAINYSLSDNFILIEVGANVNTAQEAKLTGKYIARILAEYINK